MGLMFQIKGKADCAVEFVCACMPVDVHVSNRLLVFK